jgi:hypothetical protein
LRIAVFFVQMESEGQYLSVITPSPILETG